MPESEPTPQAGTTVSPKVTVPAFAGIGIAVLLAVITAVGDTLTEDQLSPLGPWAAPVAVLVSTGVAAIVGYYKRDKLRDQTPIVVIGRAGGDDATGYAGEDIFTSDPGFPASDPGFPAGDGEHRAID